MNNVKFRLTFLQKPYGSCTFHTFCPHIPHVPKTTTRNYGSAAASFGTQTTLGVHELLLGWGGAFVETQLMNEQEFHTVGSEGKLAFSFLFFLWSLSSFT